MGDDIILILIHDYLQCWPHRSSKVYFGMKWRMIMPTNS